MRFADTLKVVSRNLRRRKGRTILTAIGVTIGTASIVAMMSLAIGLKENVVRSVSRFGNLTEIEVYPGYNPNNPAQSPRLDEQTLNSIKLLPGVSAVMPKVRFNASQGELEVNRKVGYIEILGIDTKAAPDFNYQLEEGRYLGGGRYDAVISYNVPDSLADKKRNNRRNKNGPEAQPLPPPPDSKEAKALRPNLVNKNAVITIKKQGDGGVTESKQFKVRIVGMLAQSQRSWGGPVIHLPAETVTEMNKWALGPNGENRRGGNSYESLVVKVPDRQQVENVVNQIKGMGHNAFSPITELQEVNKVFLVIQIVLGGIGAISLMVATIGIINTMVMSILERTREIGIMKVLGATIPNIRHLFLIEAGTIGFMGGTMGLIISYTIAGIINLIYRSSNFLQIPEETMGDIAVIPLWLTLFALSFATVVGVLAGIYPALRAARLSPLNAIRQE